MKLNMDSITYANGNGGIEFLEKFLKLTQIRDFGRLMTVHGDGFVCSRSLDMLDVVGCCRKWCQPSAACIPPNWAYSFAVPQGSVSGHYLQPAQK